MKLTSILEAVRTTASATVGGMSDLVESATSSFGAGLGYAKQALASSWLLGSNETIHGDVDEKHYFLIPYRLAESHYTLYSMRCLPEGVPPVNELPKKRVFHLPNEHAVKMVEQLLVDEAKANAREEVEDSGQRSSLIDLADRIDQLDQKAFNGALLIGGLVALANPLAGGVLAAKAMIPSIGLLLSKYGLKHAGAALDERNLTSRIRQAEKQVLAEFHGTTATQVVAPLLSQLDKAIRSNVFEYDPLVDGELTSELDVATPEERDRFHLTVLAIVNTYSEVLTDQRQHVAAGLGPEDIRWLQYLQTVAESEDVR